MSDARLITRRLLEDSVRTRVRWRVEVTALAELGITADQVRAAQKTCAPLNVAAWQPSNGGLTASVAAVGVEEHCELPPEAGYRSLENQLYCVAIHDGGNRAAATFKWSREGGGIPLLKRLGRAWSRKFREPANVDDAVARAQHAWAEVMRPFTNGVGTVALGAYRYLTRDESFALADRLLRLRQIAREAARAQSLDEVATCETALDEMFDELIEKIASGRLSDAEISRGLLVFKHVSGMGLEGIVSKRLGSRYRSGRTSDWLKFKNPEAPAVRREAEEDRGRGGRG